MASDGVIRSADGQTIPQLTLALKASLASAGDAGVKAIAARSKFIVAESGSRYHLKARRSKSQATARRIPLGAKSKKGPQTTVVDAVPMGFWAIVERGSNRTWRIERKLLGRGKKGRRAQLLSTPYGPRPYVIRRGQRPTGHPWSLAMSRVSTMPASVFGPPMEKVIKETWR